MTIDEMTIDELMEGKKPGEVRLRDRLSGIIFTPYFNICGQWYGIKNGHCDDFHGKGSGNWEIYNEPKPKVKRWMWVRITSEGARLNTHFLTEDEAFVHFENFKFEKLPGSEMEFDE